MEGRRIFPEGHKGFAAHLAEVEATQGKTAADAELRAAVNLLDALTDPTKEIVKKQKS